MGPRSLHVISSLRLSSGGPTESVVRLCEALNAIGAPAEIATVASPGDQAEAPPGTPLHAFPLASPASLRRSPGLEAFLEARAGRFDVVHVHGLWQCPGVYARRAAQRHGRPLVISPRGMLEPWALAQRGWLKRLALRTWEGRNLGSCQWIHATSPAESEAVRRVGFGERTLVIPNGVALQEGSPRSEGNRPRRALFLSRYHPKKGGDLLLRAWAQLGDASRDWRIDFVGPDSEGCRASWETLARSLALPPDRVGFHGPVEGQGKWPLLASSDLFILPSHSENFGNVVLEALASGIPVITTRGTPWEELERLHCGWWVEPEVAALKAALAEALTSPGERLREMGERGRTLAASFEWKAIASRMAQAYQSAPDAADADLRLR